MADVKITALAVLTAADPINDAIPIVDVSDVTMAASGTTKRISVNNILGASGTATLASATITGDLTVDTSTLKVDSTNNRVGIGTASPIHDLHVVGATNARIQAEGTSGFGMVFIQASSGNNAQVQLNSNGGSGRRFAVNSTFSGQFTISDETAVATRFAIDSTGVFTFQNVGGVAGTAMTLNSTGLGVGISPIYKFHVKNDLSELYFRDNGTASELVITSETGGKSALYFGDVADTVRGGIVYDSSVDALSFQGYNNVERLRIDTLGNVLVGLTTAGTTAAKTIQIANGTAPTANVTGGQLYVESGALKFRGSSGTITTLAVA